MRITIVLRTVHTMAVPITVTEQVDDLAKTIESLTGYPDKSMLIMFNNEQLVQGHDLDISDKIHHLDMYPEDQADNFKGKHSLQDQPGQHFQLQTPCYQTEIIGAK